MDTWLSKILGLQAAETCRVRKAKKYTWQANLDFLSINFHIVDEKVDTYGCGKSLIEHIRMKSLNKTWLSNRAIPQNKNFKNIVVIPRHLAGEESKTIGPVSKLKVGKLFSSPSLSQFSKNKDGGKQSNVPCSNVLLNVCF